MKRTIDSLATLKHVIEQHRKANTRPTRAEVAEWLWLIGQVERPAKM